jgi:hypothetical protein
VIVWRLSGFADEAYIDFGERLRFFAGLGLDRIDVRHFKRAGRCRSIAESTAGERVLLARQLGGSGFFGQRVDAPVGRAPVGGDFAIQQKRPANGLVMALEIGRPAVRNTEIPHREPGANFGRGHRLRRPRIDRFLKQARCAKHAYGGWSEARPAACSLQLYSTRWETADL